jgi:hypothetical protein
MTQLTAQEANNEIARLCNEAYKLINQAEKLADEHKLSFDFGVAYGLGGTYIGDEEERSEYCNDGWYSSSSSC